VNIKYTTTKVIRTKRMYLDVIDSIFTLTVRNAELLKIEQLVHI